jgi:hypothetical protein
VAQGWRRLFIIEAWNDLAPSALRAQTGGTPMKLLTEYLERARSFERMAAEENNREIRAQFKKLATTYRELAVKRAARYGLSAPPGASFRCPQ